MDYYSAASLLVQFFLFGAFDFSRADEDLNIVYLQLNSDNLTQIPLKFEAFGQTIDLELQRNTKLLSPNFKIYKHTSPHSIQESIELNEPSSCHYLYQDGATIAAVSMCDKGVQGLLLLNDVTLEITPLNTDKEENPEEEEERIEALVVENAELYEEIPHIVKRKYIPEKLINNLIKDSLRSTLFSNIQRPEFEEFYETIFEEKKTPRKIDEEIVLELAVFFDEAGYKLFSPFFNQDDKKIRDMLLAYINAVQALFFHPSLGIRINIELVRLDIMKRQPVDLLHYDGERLQLLYSFCNYSAHINPSADDNPDHWDIGLYVSGLDFFAYENGKKDGITMGLATVSGVCIHDFACVIAELGVSNNFGKPYPSAGFTSVFIAAHEIGHNLGMHHDANGNSCSRDGFIMSPSRGINGETVWSTCSRDVAINLPETKPCLLDKSPPQSDKDLDHTKFLTLPGRQWTAKKQCELLLRDKDAEVVTLVNACQSLQCRTPHRSGFYYAGPALDGTVCEQGKECRGGVCLPALHFKPPKRPPTDDEDNYVNENKIGWSKWKESSCTSGCVQNSKGFKSRRRVCNLKSGNKKYQEKCTGPSYDVVFCKDDKLCKKRITAEEYATVKCQEFSKKLPDLDKNGSGLQAPHEAERLWMGCAIFCRRTDIASYYTPRIELNDLGLDPYFPDGTWCHQENGEDYFCLQHHCLPSSFRFPKDGGLFKNSDVDLGPQNARPYGNKIPDELIKYFSLGIDGLPLRKDLPEIFHKDEDEWEDKDYLELPGYL